MKRWIHAANKPLSRMDPWEVKELGYNIVDSGYAKGKQDFEWIKKRLSDKYVDCKVYRVATDTPGLIMWEAYARVNDDSIHASEELTKHYKE